MILTEISNFHHNIEEMLDDLSHHHRSKDELVTLYIQNRLNKSLSTYYQELMKTYEYLDYRNDDNLIKKYERIMK